jgi:peptidoglycan/LPS O-acetylase OafA/YrhL
MSVTVPRTRAADGQRSGALDGLRGIAILLVLLSHGWTLWPSTDLNRHGFTRTLFGSGNVAVSIFFVIGGFLATRAMLAEVERTGGLKVGVLFVRRFARLSAHVYTLLAAVLFMAVLDTTDVYPKTDTRESVVRIATYTWNGWVLDHALAARPDLGHLWYVCTDLQVFLLLLALVYLLGRRRRTLLVTLLAITVAVLVWRDHVYHVEGVYAALLRTTTRMDGMIWGAVAATALPYLQRLRPRAATIGLVSLVALVPLAYYANDSAGYFGVPGFLVNVATALFVTCSMLSEPRRSVTRVLGWRPVSWLGVMSLAFYIWHYPVFWAVSRHTTTWGWFPRTVVALAITTALALLAQRFVERPVQRWLRSPRWAAYDRGIVAGVHGQLRARAAERAAARAGSAEG